MKKILLTQLACLLCISAFSQWTTQSSPTANGFNSVYFIDASNGLAGTGNGEVVKTTNAGATWAITYTVGSSLYAVYSIDANTSCAVGASGTFIKSTDGGITWSQSSTGTGYALSSITFVDPNTGFIAGNMGTLLKTTNAGSFWSALTSGTTNDLYSIYFADANNGYACGLSGTILKTVDAGATWTLLTSGTGSGLLSLYFTDVNTGYAVGMGGTILKTTDAGSTWSPLNSGTSNSLNSVRFADASNGFVAGAGGTILKTNDGGATWYTQNSGTAVPLNSVYFTDANNGFVVGGTGTILNTIDGGCATPTVSIGGTTSICSGGSTTLSANGANTYTWSTSATSASIVVSPASSTTYSVTGMSSDGCSAMSSVTVLVNSLPNITIGGANTICYNSTTNIIATGAITYTWAPATGLSSTTGANVTANPTSTTNYTVFGTDANGCSNSTLLTITVNPTPGITTTPNDVTCNGMCNGSTSAVPTSGPPPYTYLWSTSATTAGINALCAGNYTVTVTDGNGCKDSVTSPINQPSAISISFSPLVNATCIGTSDGAATANVTGGTPGYMYLWSDGSTSSSISGIVTGNYTVIVTDANSCMDSLVATIGTNSVSPTATVTGANSTCQGQPTALYGSASGGGGGYTYTWTDYQLAAQVSTTSSCTVSPMTCGYDTVTFQAMDINGCLGIFKQAIFVSYSDSLSGFVYDTNSVAVNSGNVFLFRQKVNHVGLFDTMGVTIIHPNGYYTFPNVSYGDYFVKVVADTIAYPTSIATYYSTKPNAYQWDSAQVINHYTCSATNVVGYDVHIIQMPAMLSGPGIISGVITADTSFGHRYGSGTYLPMGAPLKGVDVKLGKNPGGNAAARTTTDGNGHYTFNNVPVGNYKIYVDIPNYGMDSVLAISITTTSSVSANNNYYVDSTMIRVDTSLAVGIKTNTTPVSTVIIYPNPANDLISLHAQKELGAISIYNSLGSVVYKTTNSLKEKDAKIDVSNLPAGIYFMQVQGRFIRLVKE